MPTSIASFCTDKHVPRTPAVAVASGPFVFIYRNLRPYYKFTLPSIPVDEEEDALWEKAKEEEVGADAMKKLEKLRDTGTSPSSLICSPSRNLATKNYMKEACAKSFIQQTCVTTIHAKQR